MIQQYPRWGVQMHGRFPSDGWRTLARSWFRDTGSAGQMCPWVDGWPLTACFRTRQQARAASCRLYADYRAQGWRFRVVKLTVTVREGQ